MRSVIAAKSELEMVLLVDGAASLVFGAEMQRQSSSMYATGARMSLWWCKTAKRRSAPSVELINADCAMSSRCYLTKVWRLTCRAN